MPVKPPIQDSPLKQEQAAIMSGEILIGLLVALEHVVPTSGAGRLVSEPHALAHIINQAAAAAAPEQGDVAALISQQLQLQHVQLAPALKVRLLFWQTLFTAIEELCQLDAILKSELQRLRPLFLQAGLVDENIAINSQHPMRLFFSSLLTEGSYWYANSGKENAQFYDAVVQTVNDIAAASSADCERINTALDKFIALLGKQNARAQMMAQRCSESELGMAKIHRAQAQVVALLDSLTGCSLPESILQFLRSTLKSELQFILINQSDTAIAWQSWSAIITRLPQVFPVLAPAAEKPVEPEPPNLQQLYRDVQIIVGLLDEHVTVSAANQQVYDDGVEDLRERLFGRLRGTPEKLAPFEPLTTLDELSQMGAVVSPALLKRVAHLRVDDWFMFYNSDNQWLRCKLLLRPPHIEQLLFVNRSGHRVLQKSVRDFSACLATHIAKPLIVADTFAVALARTSQRLQLLCERNNAKNKTKTNNELIHKDEPIISSEIADASLIVGQDENIPAHDDNVLTQTPTSFEVSAAVAIEAQARASAADNDVELPPTIPAIDRTSAAQKALQEARVLEHLAIRRERQPTKPETTIAASQIEVDEPNSAPSHTVIDQLNIGAWLDLPVANQERQRCKLVAIMRSTDVFIFADRQGVKVAELQRRDLINLLTEQRAHVVSHGDNFEGQLSKVVLTLRRDL